MTSSLSSERSSAPSPPTTLPQVMQRKNCQWFPYSLLRVWIVNSLHVVKYLLLGLLSLCGIQKLGLFQIFDQTHSEFVSNWVLFFPLTYFKQPPSLHHDSFSMDGNSGYVSSHSHMDPICPAVNSESWHWQFIRQRILHWTPFTAPYLGTHSQISENRF